jgi:mannose-6-phosphate isomerase
MVWGGRRLEQRLGKKFASHEPHGESWELSDHRQHRSVAATGSWGGTALNELMANHRPWLLGSAAGRYAKFPWLIKFLDCHDWLSVQVHPDENAIARLAIDDGSKTEAWFIIDAEPGSRIYAGLEPGIDEEALRRALDAGDVASCLASFTPRPGDCVYLPAGTVHAVGGGVLMAEVQETSDSTFRLYDWGRPRELHLEQAFASIDWKRGPVKPVHVSRFAATLEHGQPSETTPLVRCAYFELDYHADTAPRRLGTARRLQALVVLEGRGEIVTPNENEPIQAGHVWLLPAEMAEAQLRPITPLKSLQCTLP